MTRALILGIGGQDGAYLARLLVARGVEVAGTTRGSGPSPRLHDLGVADAVTMRTLGDDAAVAEVIADARADHVYDLRGPVTVDGAVERTRALLGALDGRATRLLVAGAGPDSVFDADFVAAKNAAAQLVTAARSRGAFAVSAQLSEHESRLSDASTAARLIAQVQAVARGTATTIDLAHPERQHDWGWAPEYVDALRLMLDVGQPADHRVATGTRMTEREFARHACEWFGVDPGLCGMAARTDAAPVAVSGPPGWRAFTHGRDLVRTLCEGAA